MFLWVRPVESRQGLDRFYAGKLFIHVHGVQQRLIIAGLEFFGANQEAVGLFLNLVSDLARRKSV
jgi:hypothetical protein